MGHFTANDSDMHTWMNYSLEMILLDLVYRLWKHRAFFFTLHIKIQHFIRELRVLVETHWRPDFWTNSIRMVQSCNVSTMTSSFQRNRIFHSLCWDWVGLRPLYHSLAGCMYGICQMRCRVSFNYYRLNHKTKIVVHTAQSDYVC